MTDAEMLKLASTMEVEAELNPTRHSDLLREAAKTIINLVITKRVWEEIDKQRKLS